MTSSVVAPRALLPILVGLSALAETSTQLLLPALPEATAGLAASPAAIQATLSAFIVALGVSQLVVGPLSDRVGRKPVLLVGLAIYWLATIACGFVTSADQLVVARVFQGIGACAGVVVARAIARDVWGREAASALALIVFGMMIALMLSPLVGGLVSGWFGWRAVFWFAAGLGAIAVAAVAFGYTETRPALAADAPSAHQLPQAYLSLLADRGYLAFTLALGCTYGVLFAFVTGSSFVLVESMGLTQAQCGLAVAVVLLGLVMGTLAARRLSAALGPAQLVRLGTAIVLGGTLTALVGALGRPHDLVALLAPQIAITLGAGLVLPSAVAGAVMPFASRAGLAAGCLGFAQMAIAAGFGLLLGAWHGTAAMPMLWVQAIAAAAAFTLFRALTPAPALQST